MRITLLHSLDVVWLACPACRLKCRPGAVGPDGQCPRCGEARILKLPFGGQVRETSPAPNCG